MLKFLVKRSVSPSLRQGLLELPRHRKRALLVGLDFITLSALLWVLMSVRSDQLLGYL